MYISNNEKRNHYDDKCNSIRECIGEVRECTLKTSPNIGVVLVVRRERASERLKESEKMIERQINLIFKNNGPLRLFFALCV